MPSISLADVVFASPDSRPVLAGVSLSLGPGLFGLTGPGGGGKSTLLKLIAGLLPPASGQIAVQGRVAYLPQRLSADRVANVAQLLQVAAPLEALRRIEAGSVAAADFDAVGEDWDVEERVAAQLGRLGIDGIGLERTVASVSGGEAVSLALAGLLLQSPQILLLDEPTNNLDRASAGRLMDVIGQFKGVVLAVTHDAALLDRTERIGELRGGELAWYPAPFARFEEAKAAAREAARRRVAHAKSQVKAQSRDLAEAQTKQARRDAKGRAAAGGMPKAVAHYFQGRAERTSAKTRAVQASRLAQAREELDQANDALEGAAGFRLELPAAAVPRGRTVLELDRVRPAHTDLEVSLSVKGPERIGLTGPNGIGKTSLLRCVLGEAAPEAGTVKLHVPARDLPQDLALLDDSLTVLENAAGGTADLELRDRLARLGFRGERAFQLAGTLSGCERFRATLATLLLRGIPPQLLILDEPTNNLDLDSRAFLVEALASWPGALMVVSHDWASLDRIGLTSRLALG